MGHNSNYFVMASYDGSHFHGWAKQINTRTIQGEIEKIVKQLFQQDITIHGSGRTDAYVHAVAQTFSFKAKHHVMNNKELLKAMNSLAPSDIHFVSIKLVDGTFNARFSALSKTYKYVINNGEFNVFRNNYELFYPHKLNLNLIKKGSKLLIGQHDFKSFSTSELSDTVRSIHSIRFSKHKDYLEILIKGNGFLRSMVRMIVGTLLDLNENKKTMDDIKKLLQHPIKGSAVTKVRGAGLYLYKVYY